MLENLSPTKQRSDRTIHGGHLREHLGLIHHCAYRQQVYTTTSLPGPELQGHVIPEQGLLSVMSPNSVLQPIPTCPNGPKGSLRDTIQPPLSFLLHLHLS